jgi:hypothetical protein
MDPGDEMLKAIVGDDDDSMWLQPLDEAALLCEPLLTLAHLSNTFECDCEPADDAPPPIMSTFFNSHHEHEEDEALIHTEQHLMAHSSSYDEDDWTHKLEGCDDDGGLAIHRTSSSASPPASPSASPPLPLESTLTAATNEPMTMTTKKVVLRLFGSGFTANHLREQHPEYSALIGQHFGTWLQLKDRTYANKGYLEHVIDQQVDCAYSYDNTKVGGVAALSPRLLTKSELLDSMKQRMRDEKSKIRKQEKKKSAIAEMKTTKNAATFSSKKLRKSNKTSLSTTSTKKRTATICYGGGDNSSGSYDDQGHFSYELVTTPPRRSPPVTNKKYKVEHKKTPPLSLVDHCIAAPPPPPFLIRNSTSDGTIVCGHGHDTNSCSNTSTNNIDNDNDYFMVDPSSMLMLQDDSFLADYAGGDGTYSPHSTLGSYTSSPR